MSATPHALLPDATTVRGPFLESHARRYEHTASCSCGHTETADTAETATARIRWHIDIEEERARIEAFLLKGDDARGEYTGLGLLNG